jgi:hypothetical protein
MFGQSTVTSNLKTHAVLERNSQSEFIARRHRSKHVSFVMAIADETHGVYSNSYESRNALTSFALESRHDVARKEFEKITKAT